MKRRRFELRLTYRQHLALAMILVLLLAVSLLYCLGFASLTLHQAWENHSLPGNGSPAEGLDLPFAPLAPSPATTPP